MKVISFSLYGEDPIYTKGCIRNAEIKKEVFKEWEMWVYHNDTVPQDILDKLIELDVKLINTNENNGFFGSLWRFNSITEPNTEYFISRDCDSRISQRDVTAVNEWIESDKTFHIIRDHPIGHGWPISAGLWGSKGSSISAFNELKEKYLLENNRMWDRSIDQCFLRDVIYPIAATDVFVHDEYFNYEGIGQPIKQDRAIDNFAFIGESIDENDIPRGDLRTPIINFYNAR
jgi:hypothetical protein